VTAFFDRTIDAVIVEHLNERQRLMAQRISSQRDVVAAIMAGRPVDPVVAQAVLGVDLDQHHMAFLVWHDDPDLLGGAAHSYLGRIAGTICRALRCPAPVAANTDATTLRAWASRARPFGDGDVAVLREMTWERGVHIAVGPPGAGIAGYRRSHLAAEDAYRLARSLPVGPSVVVHRDVALAALLATDLERARWFVGEELGRLAVDDEGTADLRTTLLSFLDNGGSLVRAAAALHVHRNTVVYRLRRAENLLGHAISERVLETHTALRLATVLPRE
jgi:DNA-binding PucR family transcriptional regulator